MAGCWQVLSKLLAGCKGNLSRQRGHSLKHIPDYSFCISTHIHTQACLLGTGPFHLTAFSSREGIYSLWQWHSVVLLEMVLSPSNMRHCWELAHIEPCVLWPSCPASRGERLSDPAITPYIQPHVSWCFLYFLVLNELENILYSSVSQTVMLCRARLICFAQFCLVMQSEDEAWI